MAKNDQSGIGVVEVFIILLVIGVMGFIGWYVWHPKAVVNKPQVNVKDGWSIYRSAHSDATFQYPTNWKLTEDFIASTDTLKLEDATLVGPNNFMVAYSLNKTYHGKILRTASCVAPPKITVVSSVGDKLAISYDSYRDIPTSLWLATTGTLKSGYGYATGQCRVRGVDYISLPNDEYITLDASYAVDRDSPLAQLNTVDFLDQPEVKTAIDIFKTFKP